MTNYGPTREVSPPHPLRWPPDPRLTSLMPCMIDRSILVLSATAPDSAAQGWSNDLANCQPKRTRALPSCFVALETHWRIH